MANCIGLDIGGTKINGIVWDGKKIVRELTVETPKKSTAFTAAVHTLVAFLSNGKVIDGLGVGMAGIVDSKGMLVYNPNMPGLKDFKAEKYFRSLGIKKVRIENDANCFALAEARLGKGKKYKNFVGLTLGTGIGGGIIHNSQLYRGSHGSAGEAGHLMADFKYDSEHYYQQARDKKNFSKVGEVVGLLFANITNVLDAEAIILGGTVALRHSTQFLPKAMQIAKKHIVNKHAFPDIIISDLKNSGSLGAALLCED